ncbi:MAG: TolC family protein, partial [Bacteroidales bacterium]|nr:TolC family protein [Bacteroidales bacterium]
MRTTITIARLLAALTASGQTHSGPWTLAECVRHAQENNLTLKQTELQVKQRELQLETATGNRLPQVSGSVSENFSFGRGLTADNTYSNTNTTSTGLSLGTSVPVFQGLRISNNIKESELGLKAATADL